MRDAVSRQDLEDRIRRERREDLDLSNRALILRSPNGTLWKIVISDAGVVSGVPLS